MKSNQTYQVQNKDFEITENSFCFRPLTSFQTKTETENSVG